MYLKVYYGHLIGKDKGGEFKWLNPTEWTFKKHELKINY